MLNFTLSNLAPDLSSPYYTMSESAFLIEASDALTLLDKQNLLIIDLGSLESYQQQHLPGAIHLDYAQIVHGAPPAPGSLPSLQRLQTLFDTLGLNKRTTVLIYDDEGSGRAGRFAWTLDVIGHRDYFLLNGGIHAWLDASNPTSTAMIQPTASHANINIQNAPLADKAYVLSILDSDAHILLDTRSEEEYAGLRGGARHGHIPGAVNFNWLDAIDRQNHLRYVADHILNTQFDALGLHKDKQIIPYCFSFHRAAHTYAVLKHLGYPNVKGYAGSWAEWSSDASLPIE